MYITIILQRSGAWLVRLVEGARVFLSQHGAHRATADGEETILHGPTAAQRDRRAPSRTCPHSHNPGTGTIGTLISRKKHLFRSIKKNKLRFSVVDLK